MNKYINIYGDNPTAGQADGTYVPKISVTLDSAKNESVIVPCAVRCEAGYKTASDTVISFDGATKGKWQVCATEDGTFADALTITDPIGQKNILFYVKASSSDDESPINDGSVNLQITTKIAAAE